MEQINKSIQQSSPELFWHVVPERKRNVRLTSCIFRGVVGRVTSSKLLSILRKSLNISTCGGIVVLRRITQWPPLLPSDIIQWSLVDEDKWNRAVTLLELTDLSNQPPRVIHQMGSLMNHVVLFFGPLCTGVVGPFVTLRADSSRTRSVTAIKRKPAKRWT